MLHSKPFPFVERTTVNFFWVLDFPQDGDDSEVVLGISAQGLHVIRHGREINKFLWYDILHFSANFCCKYSPYTLNLK